MNRTEQLLLSSPGLAVSLGGDHGDSIIVIFPGHELSLGGDRGHC